MAIINFDARTVEPDAGRAGAIPAGWYALLVKKLEFGPTNDGQGEKIDAQFEVTEGTYKGAMVFHNFNMKNASEKAEKIGRGQFSALCHATGKLVVQATEELLNLPFKAKLKIDIDATGQYEPKNVVMAFKNYNDPSAVDIAAATAGPAAKPAGTPTVTPPATQAWATPAAAVTPPPAAASAPATAVAQPWSQPAAAAPAPAPAAPAPVAAAPALVQVEGAQYTIAQCLASSWTEQQMIDNGIATRNVPAAPAPAAPAPAAAQPSWAAAPATDPNAVAASAAAPAPGQTAAPSPGPEVAQVVPAWMNKPA